MIDEKDTLSELDEFFGKHPEDAKFEIEKPDEALEADTNYLAKLSTDQYKLTEFEQRCNRGYKKVISDIKTWVRNNNDVIIAVCGPEGSGKSYFSLMKLCRDLDSHFLLERNVLLRPTPEKLEQTIFQVNQYGVHMTDEAMDVLYKRQAATSTNIGLTKLFARVRKFNRIAVLVLPDFSDLDPFFRKRRVRVRIEIVERGLGFIMVAKNLVGNADPWFSDYNEHILQTEFEEQDLTKATGFEKLAVYEKFRCFETPIIWHESQDPEDKALWAKYEQMAKDSNLEARHEDALSKEHLTRPDKAYRKLFAELSKRWMLSEKLTPEEAYALFPRMLGDQPPFTLGSFKFMTSEQKNWRQMRKEARIVNRGEMPTQPKNLLEGV